MKTGLCLPSATKLVKLTAQRLSVIEKHMLAQRTQGFCPHCPLLRQRDLTASQCELHLTNCTQEHRFWKLLRAETLTTNLTVYGFELVLIKNAKTITVEVEPCQQHGTVFA